MRFLLRWQHVAPGTQLAGEAGLAAALEQLQGYEAAAVAWEPDLLARRLRHYDPAWLDRLCHDGEVGWLRLTPRAARRRRQPGRPAVEGHADHGRVPRRSPMAARGRRGREPIRPNRPWARPPRSSRCCASGARASRPSSATSTNRLPEDIERALWDGVSRGLLTADGFGAIRSRVEWQRSQPRHRLAPLVPPAARSRSPGAAAGRWSLVPTHRRRHRPRRAGRGRGRAAAAPLGRRVPRPRGPRLDPHPVARGPVGVAPPRRPRPRRAAAASSPAFSGEQYALPQAIEQLTQMRKVQRTGERVVVNATDPLNVVGIDRTRCERAVGPHPPGHLRRRRTGTDHRGACRRRGAHRVTLRDRIRKPLDTMRSVMQFRPVELDPVKRRLARAADVADLRADGAGGGCRAACSTTSTVAPRTRSPSTPTRRRSGASSSARRDPA